MWDVSAEIVSRGLSERWALPGFPSLRPSKPKCVCDSTHSYITSYSKLKKKKFTCTFYIIKVYLTFLKSKCVGSNTEKSSPYLMTITTAIMDQSWLGTGENTSYLTDTEIEICATCISGKAILNKVINTKYCNSWPLIKSNSKSFAHAFASHRTEENSTGFRQFKKLSFEASLKKQAAINFFPSGII